MQKQDYSKKSIILKKQQATELMQLKQILSIKINVINEDVKKLQKTKQILNKKKLIKKLIQNFKKQ